LSVLISFWGNL